MSGIATHSFDRIRCIVGAAPIIDWWEGDAVIRVIKGDDAVRTMVGADGRALASISSDLSAVIELQLKPSSVSNTYLHALLRDFRRSLRPRLRNLAITDFSTSELKTSSSCIVLAEPADVSLGKAATVRTWRLFCGEINTVTIGQL